MCGRFQLADDKDIEEINKIIAEVQANINRREKGVTGDIYPTNHAAVIVKGDGEPKVTVMKWGFPMWNGKGVLINARSETALEKKTFSQPLRKNRCVIPSTGFYEWTHKNGKPVDKYLFTPDGESALYMAGAYDVFKDANGQHAAFVIFTTAANQYISSIHDRMPVILNKNELEDWLWDDAFIPIVFQRTSSILHHE